MFAYICGRNLMPRFRRLNWGETRRACRLKRRDGEWVKRGEKAFNLQSSLFIRRNSP